MAATSSYDCGVPQTKVGNAELRPGARFRAACHVYTSVVLQRARHNTHSAVSHTAVGASQSMLRGVVAALAPAGPHQRVILLSVMTVLSFFLPQ